jgi:hypothetical protein
MLRPRSKMRLCTSSSATDCVTQLQLTVLVTAAHEQGELICSVQHQRSLNAALAPACHDTNAVAQLQCLTQQAQVVIHIVSLYAGHRAAVNVDAPLKGIMPYIAACMLGHL